jgi:hypothetical protein
MKEETNVTVTVAALRRLVSAAIQQGRVKTLQSWTLTWETFGDALRKFFHAASLVYSTT